MEQKSMLLALTFILLLCVPAGAQLNVGSTDAPHSSAALQISPTDKGLRLPQVSLTATYTYGLNGTPAPASIGMEVYNTNAAIIGSKAYPAFGAGIYVWDGQGWYTQVAKAVAQSLKGPTVIAGFTPNNPSNASYVPLPFQDVVISQDSSYVKFNSNLIYFQKMGMFRIHAVLNVYHVYPNTTNGTGFYNFFLNKYLDATTVSIVATSQVPAPAVTYNSQFIYAPQLTLSATLSASAGDVYYFGAYTLGLQGSETTNPVNYTMDDVTITLLREN